MDKLRSFQEIQNTVSAIKEAKRGFITNFFPEINKINAWIKKEELYIKVIADTAFYFKKKAMFTHLFFSTTSIGSLNKSLAELRNHISESHPLVVDIIGKQTEVMSIADCFTLNGFYPYTSLHRMSRIPSDEKYKIIVTTIKAEARHAAELYDLLHQYFDPLAEQLPTLEDINKWIQLNHISLVEEKEKILGFVIYDITGLTSYLRYWFVLPHHRDRKIGSSLLTEFFRNSVGVKRQLFWVIQSNENAINRYLHYGFQPENLVDLIMTNKNMHYEAGNN